MTAITTCLSREVPLLRNLTFNCLLIAAYHRRGPLLYLDLLETSECIRNFPDPRMFVATLFSSQLSWNLHQNIPTQCSDSDPERAASGGPAFWPYS